MLDLAAMNVKTADKMVTVEPGDMIEIIAPWTSEENFLGIVLETCGKYFVAYHGLQKQKITWSKCVNCKIFRYNHMYEKKEKTKKRSC